jgi:chromosome segregation ATPase
MRVCGVHNYQEESSPMLKFKIQKLDDVDEAYRDFYQEAEGGGYQLKVDGLEDTGALKRAKDHEKAQRQEAEKARKALEDRVKELEAAAEEAGQQGARDKGDVEAVEKSWRTKLEKREGELTGQIETLKGNLQELLVDGQAMRLASELAVEGSADVLVPHIKRRLAAEERDGKYQTTVLDSEGQPSASTLDELREEFVGNKAFAPLIAGSKASGSGASGGNNGGSAAPTGNMGGSKEERRAAIAAKYPELSQSD